MHVADPLSRQLDHYISSDNDNKDQVLLNPVTIKLINVTGRMYKECQLLIMDFHDVCASSEVSNWEHDADMLNGLTKPLMTTIKLDDADSSGVLSMYLGGMCWHAGDTSRPEGQSDGSGCQMDGLRGSADALKALNRAETEVIGHGEGAGMYLVTGDTKHVIYMTDGVGSPTDMLTGHGEIPCIGMDTYNTENEAEIISIPQKQMKSPDSPMGTAIGCLKLKLGTTNFPHSTKQALSTNSKLVFTKYSR